MSLMFEELDWRPTPIGTLSLRRRRDLADGADIYEIKLGDDFLMSSRFTVAEEELARIGLAAAGGDDLDVVVGGLGLGCTAAAALDDGRLRSLVVVDALPAVIDWHRQGLLPLGQRLTADSRCRLVEGDFFAGLATPGAGLVPGEAQRRFDVLLLDIDHSPREVLAAGNAALYEPAGLCWLAEQLRPGGIFALWSNEPPDEAFTTALQGAFHTARSHVISFANPLQNREAANTVYVASVADRPEPEEPVSGANERKP